MKVIEKIRMAATIVFVVAIALAVAYHQEIGSWLMEQFTGKVWVLGDDIDLSQYLTRNTDLIQE